jgi:hypothetical protein
MQYFNFFMMLQSFFMIGPFNAVKVLTNGGKVCSKVFSSAVENLEAAGNKLHSGVSKVLVKQAVLLVWQLKGTVTGMAGCYEPM